MSETITPFELNRGWYMSTEKKEGTPNDWVFTSFRGMSTWGDCNRLKQAYAQNPGTCPGGVACPPVDCKLPSWATDFKANDLMGYTNWLLKSNFPIKQKLQGAPTVFKLLGIGGILVIILVLAGTGITILKISKN